MSYKTIQRLVAIGEAILIPQSLIDKLKPYGLRFIKVAKPIPGDEHSGKNAVEHAWQEHPYEAEDPSLQDWVRKGNNYGVLAGEGVVIVETDTKESTEGMAKINTFTVQSGGGGYKRHVQMHNVSLHFVKQTSA